MKCLSNIHSSIRLRFLFTIPVAMLLLSAPIQASSENEVIDGGVDSPVELTAPIMKIDLNNNLLVIAEKDVFLLAKVEEGKKRWITEIVDKNGQSLSLSTLKQRDRVKVEGSAKNEMEISAKKITLLTPAAAQTGSTATSGNADASPPRLVNGVWSN